MLSQGSPVRGIFLPMDASDEGNIWNVKRLTFGIQSLVSRIKQELLDWRVSC